VIHHCVGNVTELEPSHLAPIIIAHVVNDRGGWGAGFVMALSRKWAEPERAYRAWGSKMGGYRLGSIQVVPVAPNLYVANMVAQAGYASRQDPQPFRMVAAEECLKRLNTVAEALQATVHLPRIGAGLGGADWGEVEALLHACLSEATVYTLKAEIGKWPKVEY